MSASSSQGFDEKKVVLEDVPPPTGDGVLVQVRACGICGSDVTILDSGFPISGTPGHEISGELEDGTPVAIEHEEEAGAISWMFGSAPQKPAVSTFGVVLERGAASRLAEQPAARGECAICFREDARKCVLIPCGHRCACLACSEALAECPICRVRVERVQEVYEA